MDREKMTSLEEKKKRWKEPFFIEVKRFILKEGEFSAIEYAKEWYKKAPKVFNPMVALYTTEEDRMRLDLDCIDLSGRELGEALFFGCHLKHANLSHCHFNCTRLQSTYAHFADFSHSVFEKAQMSPFFGVGADFSHCTMKGCYTISFGHKSDFSDANFSFAKCRDNAMEFNIFDRTNFSNANFLNCEMHSSTFKDANFKDAFIKRCDFNNDEPYGCDFTGADFTDAKFIQCDFRNAILDDTPLVRDVINSGFNKNTDLIVWKK